MTTQTTKSKTTKEIERRPMQETARGEATRPGTVFTPAVDIYETDDAIVVIADMPGVRADGLEIDLRENVLTIDGRLVTEEPTTTPGMGERLLLQEYETGGFHREFRLTNLIDRARIDASLKHGILRLTLPKAENARPRRIEVHAD